VDSTLISFCIPCHNRTYDLKKTLPITVEAANQSPPVEIVILDYNSPDDLQNYTKKAIQFLDLTDGNSFLYKKYDKRDYFHKAHAFNLAVLTSHGKYCVLMGTDAFPSINYVQELRKLIRENCIWMRSDELHGIICFKKQEFINTGGYDERFEFYGSEDRDLDARLQRRGRKFGLLPNGVMHVIETPNSEKIKNYRLQLSKKEMSQYSKKILDENNEKEVLVVNLNGWGKWE